MQKPLPPDVNPRKGKTMKQLRTNMRALNLYISHSKLVKNTQKCFDILPCVHFTKTAHTDQQAERLPSFHIPSNSYVNRHGTWPAVLVQRSITCSSPWCNFVPLTEGDSHHSSTIAVAGKISLEAKASSASDRRERWLCLLQQGLILQE